MAPEGTCFKGHTTHDMWTLPLIYHCPVRLCEHPCHPCTELPSVTLPSPCCNIHSCKCPPTTELHRFNPTPTPMAPISFLSVAPISLPRGGKQSGWKPGLPGGEGGCIFTLHSLHAVNRLPIGQPCSKLPKEVDCAPIYEAIWLKG